MLSGGCQHVYSKLPDRPIRIVGLLFCNRPAGLTTLNVNGLTLVLKASRIAANYAPAANPTSLLQGVLSGFMTLQDTKETLFPASVPAPLGGQPLYKALADAQKHQAVLVQHTATSTKAKAPTAKTASGFISTSGPRR